MIMYDASSLHDCNIKADIQHRAWHEFGMKL